MAIHGGFLSRYVSVTVRSVPLWGGGVVFDRPIFGVEDWLGQSTSACNQLHPSMLRSVLWLLHWWPLKFVSRFRALRASIRSSARQKRFGQSPTKFMHSSRIGISDVASISRAFPAISFLNKDSRPPVIVPKHCRITSYPAQGKQRKSPIRRPLWLILANWI